MTKQELRKIYKQKRLSLSSNERLKLDDLLLIQLQRLALPNEIHAVMSFWPLERYGEINTHLFISYLEHAFPGLQTAFPVVNFFLSEMNAELVNDDTEFIENDYGIPEPQQSEEITAELLDLILVPLLAFDANGFRVGFGKGFYDRFLKKCSDNVITIGFSYFDAVEKIDDAGPFDVPLKYCITPQKIYEF